MIHKLRLGSYIGISIEQNHYFILGLKSGLKATRKDRSLENCLKIAIKWRLKRKWVRTEIGC